jgi:transposase
MTAVPSEPQAFLNQYRDSYEYPRGLVVKLAFQGYLYATICEMLDVTSGFISQAKTAYETAGIDGLRLKYQGGQPFLSEEQQQADISWLKPSSAGQLSSCAAILRLTTGQP